MLASPFYRVCFCWLAFLSCLGSLAAQPGQIAIPRIDQMPDQPTPFNIRDWRTVALEYDSFVYDVNRTGQYLPLIRLRDQGFNYPGNPAFRMDTYVGTNRSNQNEAINVLPSIVSASLMGIDKTDQYGQNWVLMSQDFFNRNNNHNIYLNAPNAGSGGDWWYDLMPNVYFYQLYDLYPGVGDAEAQFTHIADRFAESVRSLGGNDAPWSAGNFDYRAFNFLTQQPNPDGVPEPEAAGAYAWVLYHAFRQKGNPEYLKAAEWSLEFLDDWPTNPSYELQLPYGTYTAARMNAELGTTYDVEKMMNWSFDRGPLRGWGTIVGRWNGFDVSGLVGEANDNGNDYAFQLNGVQQAAALVPAVRYDKRFAHAIGKWVLNLANATRLFFPDYLPGFLQDSDDWSEQNDPNRVMGYEALREVWQGNSPYSTGDAIRGGWAETNLSLYSTGSIGYLGTLIEPTNVDQILQIDLLATDFFGDEAYPTYLYVNPYDLPQSVTLDVGTGSVDIYEALSETFPQKGVSGEVSLTIAAGEAIMVVLAPAGGTITYDLNRMLIDGVVVDYQQSAQAINYPPRIQSLSAGQSEIEEGDILSVFAKAQHPQNEPLTYQWSASGGTLSGDGDQASYLADTIPGDYEVQVIVQDPDGQTDTATVSLSIVAEINQAPDILELIAAPGYGDPGDILPVSVVAADANGDSLSYTWTVTGGTLIGEGSQVNWQLPEQEGSYEVEVTVSDGRGLSASAKTTALVKSFVPTSGNLLAYYPFSGNPEDASGNGLDGTAFGARLVDDQFGIPLSAYLFDGVNDRITVPYAAQLDVRDAISVSAWIRADQLPDRELFIVSHGSWQNRWKVSLTPEGRIRWTVNSTQGIRDVDAPQPVQTDSYYHFTATFDGEAMVLYINGNLVAYQTLGGTIRPSSLDLLIGQMLPGDANFNFPGLIDEVRLHDYALDPEAAMVLYQESLVDTRTVRLLDPDVLTIYPNPVKERIRGEVEGPGNLTIQNLWGQTLHQETIADGLHQVDQSVKNWPPGLYLATLRRGQALRTIRLIVE